MDKKKSIKEVIILILIIVIILLIKKYLFAPVLVNGDSMYSTLHDKDLMILNKINYKLNGINRFDILVINHCEKDKESNVIIKFDGVNFTYTLLLPEYESVPEKLNEMYSFKEVTGSYKDEYMNESIAKKIIEDYRDKNIQEIDSDWNVKNLKIKATGNNNTYLINYTKEFNSDECTRMVKRVIGLPNDKIRFENNKLYINDAYIEEPYLDENTYTEDLENYIVPEGYYYVLGDNRAISLDSRFLGPISIDEVEGTASLTLFPFNRIGFK